MAYRRRSSVSRTRRATRGNTRRAVGRRAYTPRRTRSATRSYSNRQQTVRLVIESGPSSLVQRPDGLMAAVTQPTDGKAKF